MVTYLTPLFLGNPLEAVYHYKVSILSPVTENLLFLNQRKRVYITYIQGSPDRTRLSGSTELMRVKGEAHIKYLSHFSGPTNFYVYGSIRHCLHYATVLLIFDPIKCVKYLEAIN